MSADTKQQRGVLQQKLETCRICSNNLHLIEVNEEINRKFKIFSNVKIFQHNKKIPKYICKLCFFELERSECFYNKIFEGEENFRPFCNILDDLLQIDYDFLDKITINNIIIPKKRENIQSSCEECSKSFSINLPQVFECKICNEEFNKCCALKEHYLHEHDLSFYICLECGDNFRCDDELLEHLKTHLISTCRYNFEEQQKKLPPINHQKANNFNSEIIIPIDDLKNMENRNNLANLNSANLNTNSSSLIENSTNLIKNTANVIINSASLLPTNSPNVTNNPTNLIKNSANLTTDSSNLTTDSANLTENSTINSINSENSPSNNLINNSATLFTNSVKNSKILTINSKTVMKNYLLQKKISDVITQLNDSEKDPKSWARERGTQLYIKGKLVYTKPIKVKLMEKSDTHCPENLIKSQKDENLSDLTPSGVIKMEKHEQDINSTMKPMEKVIPNDPGVPEKRRKTSTEHDKIINNSNEPSNTFNSWDDIFDYCRSNLTPSVADTVNANNISKNNITATCTPTGNNTRIVTNVTSIPAAVATGGPPITVAPSTIGTLSYSCISASDAPVATVATASIPIISAPGNNENKENSQFKNTIDINFVLKCPICNVKFIRYSDFKSHGQKHQKNKVIYTCKTCGKLFSEFELFCRHMEEQHKVSFTRKM